MRQSVSITRNLGRTAAGLAASLMVIGTVVVLGASSALAITPGNTAIPVPGLTANCPGGPPAVGAGSTIVSGIHVAGIGGSCTASQAVAAVGKTTFGVNTILSASSRCTTNGAPFSVVTGPSVGAFSDTVTHTLVTSDGYTLNLNVPVTVGTQSGRIAVQIVGPGGSPTVNIAEVLCAGASPGYPLKADLSANQAPLLSPVSSSSHGSGSSALLLLVGALVAFVAVNVTGVRRYRRRHTSTAG